MSESKLKVQVLEGADNKLDLAKLEDVLKRKLIIPSYQRPYAWKAEDIEEIFQTIKYGKDNKEDICFFGSIILSKKGNGYGQEEYYIIDGQQRLSSLLEFIKNSGNYKSLPGYLDEKITTIYEKHPILNEDTMPDSNNIILFNEHIDKILQFLDLVLNKVKFCLICITGENSEDFAINLFNRLNTTGQPLTAFEVLRSELHIIDPKLSKQINEIQSEIIKLYTFKRKKIVTHTGKLLLYLALYRGDFKEDDYTLSDNKFKAQRSYLKQILNKQSAPQLVEDVKDINNFYSKNWLKPDSIQTLLKHDNEKVCFHFISELKHDRVLPMLIRFHKNNRNELGRCLKMCTAFSSLWRAYCDGGTSGIDNAYKDIYKNISKIKDCTISILNEHLKKIFMNKLSVNSIKEIKHEWIQKLKTSTLYKNQKLSKLLLFLAYNQRYFDTNKKSLIPKKGIDILNIHYWNHEDYKTIEHIIPKSHNKLIGHIHTLGNLTLLPQQLNSSIGDKPFSKKLPKYKQFCSIESSDNYPYLPVIKHIAHYEQFTEKEIEERSKILSEFIWKTLAEDWLGWKD